MRFFSDACICCLYAGRELGDNKVIRRTIGSLSGATLVRTNEASGPIPLSDVTTGQHVACLGDLADLSLTPTTRWCEVKAFVRNKLRGRPRRTVHFLQHLVVLALRSPKASACAVPHGLGISHSGSACCC